MGRGLGAMDIKVKVNILTLINTLAKGSWFKTWLDQR